MPVSKASIEAQTDAIEAAAKALHDAAYRATMLVKRDDKNYKDSAKADFSLCSPGTQNRYRETVKILVAAGIWRLHPVQ